MVFPPGDSTMVHVPPAGKPLNSTLPVDVMQSGCVTWPITGIEGLGSTVSENVAIAALHFVRLGILVVTVITTTEPPSPADGVYVISNGVFEVVAGITVPVPLVVIKTFVALPPNVFPEIVIGVDSQVVPLVLLRVTVGGLEHCPRAIFEIIKKMVTKRSALVIFSIT